MCLAPWLHTYLSPQTERRMCCASREPAQSFEQYIDTDSGSGSYHPISLDEHINSPHMMDVRKRMMAGETLPECDVCNNKLLNTDVYRDYFWHLFKHKYEDIWHETEPDGYTFLNTISWDYRFSNLCNFKCRQCGDMLSSAWESEERKNDMIDFGNPKNNWMQKDVRKEIKTFQEETIEWEFSQAVEEGNVEEIYWVGGEPLMFEQHWKYMKRIIELGDGPKLYARYNTNLHSVNYRGQNLFKDILPHIRDWQICASIDGTGEIGEYIRTGMVYDVFIENYKAGQAIALHPRQMRLDFTLTLPGLFELKNMFDLSKELNTMMLAKVTFSFTPDILMSPLALPRHLLNKKIDEFLAYASDVGYDQSQQPLIDLVQQLKHRPTFEEEWPDDYIQGAVKGKKRVRAIESIRPASCNLEDILKDDKEIYDWYNNIDE